MSTGKFFCVKWVRSKAGHWLLWKLKWINTKLMPLRSKMMIRISLHLSFRDTEVVRCKLHTMLKFLNLFSCWVFLLGSWYLVNWTLSAWCQDVKLSVFWASHYKLHHLGLFALWESKLSLSVSKCWASFTHPLPPVCIYWNMRKVFISVHVGY